MFCIGRPLEALVSADNLVWTSGHGSIVGHMSRDSTGKRLNDCRSSLFPDATNKKTSVIRMKHHLAKLQYYTFKELHPAAPSSLCASYTAVSRISQGEGF